MCTNVTFWLHMYFSQAQEATGQKTKLLEIHKISEDICTFCCSDIHVSLLITNKSDDQQGMGMKQGRL